MNLTQRDHDWLDEHRADLLYVGRHERHPLKQIDEFLAICAETTQQDIEYVRRVLQQQHISDLDIELYVNYPDWTEYELAAEFGMTQPNVHARLARLRSILPTLRRDFISCNPHPVPAVQNMDRIEFSDSDRLDEDKIRQKF